MGFGLSFDTIPGASALGYVLPPLRDFQTRVDRFELLGFYST
jgi:hypothetical protein